MTALAQDLRTYAVRRWPTTNHKWRKARLASILGLTERRVRSLYEGEETAVLRQHEADAITNLIGAAREREIDEANAHDFTALQARVARLEALLLEQEAAANRRALAATGEVADGRRRAHVANHTRRD